MKLLQIGSMIQVTGSRGAERKEMWVNTLQVLAVESGGKDGHAVLTLAHEEYVSVIESVGEVVEAMYDALYWYGSLGNPINGERS